MFEIMIATFYYAFYIGIFGIFVLMGFRLYVAISKKFNIKDLLLIVLLPGSIGLSLKTNHDYPFKKLYHILYIFFFTLMIIGSIFLLYMRLELDII
ncbi:MAG TPA: hypothetical protein PLJ98_09355 [Acholeplasmataceae bacterium]|nr:hypothetical protein [Acholeplasmataceae bacterium]